MVRLCTSGVKGISHLKSYSHEKNESERRKTFNSRNKVNFNAGERRNELSRLVSLALNMTGRADVCREQGVDRKEQRLQTGVGLRRTQLLW